MLRPLSHILLTALALTSTVTDAHRIYRRDCKFTWPAIDGDTCSSMARDWAIDEQLFRAINPGIDCAKLDSNKEYCVEWDGPAPSLPPVTSAPVPTAFSSTTLVTKTSSTPPSGPAPPSPVQEGIAANCQTWYLVSSSDTCQKIVDIYKTFTLAQFYQWNPAVGTGCGSLWPSYFVCVGVPGTPTAAPTTASTTKPTVPTSTAQTPVPPAGTPKPCRYNASKGQYDCPGIWPAAPGPVQDGVPYNCVKWVLQKNGVFCADMAKTAGISLASFYSLNPGVGTSCGGLWPGYAYCTATGY